MTTKLFGTAICFLLLLNASSQKTEIKVLAGAGFLSFAGSYTSSSTYFVKTDPVGRTGYTTETFGKKAVFGYSVAGSFTRISRNHLYWGLEAGYEQLKSKIPVDFIYTGGYSPYIDPATGQQTYSLQFINLFPNVGYRLAAGKIHFGFTIGSDVGLCLSRKEMATATSKYGETFLYPEHHQAYPTVDVRPAIRLSAGYRRYSIYAGYAFGITNDAASYQGKAYSRIIRLGLAYSMH